MTTFIVGGLIGSWIGVLCGWSAHALMVIADRLNPTGERQ